MRISYTKLNTGFISSKLIRIYFAISVCLVFLIASQTAIAQKPDSAALAIKRQYVESMKNYIGIKLSLNNAVEEFSVKTDDVKYQLLPNTSTVARINLNYRLLSFNYGFSPKFIGDNRDADTKGKSKFNSFGFGFPVGKFFNELNYQKTRGYYVDNTKDFDPTWKDGDPYIQVPSLKVVSFEGLTGYNFNRNYSQAAIITQTERQLKSAGSFIPKLFYRYYIIDNQDKEDRSQTSSQKSNNFQVILGAGYHHTFVINKTLYFALGFTPAVGHQWTKLKTRLPDEDIISHQRNWVLQWDARAGVGYNNERLFGGFYVAALDNSYRQGASNAVNENLKVRYQIFLGYRFRAPKFLVKTYDAVEKEVKRELKSLQGQIND